MQGDRRGDGGTDPVHKAPQSVILEKQAKTLVGVCVKGSWFLRIGTRFPAEDETRSRINGIELQGCKLVEGRGRNRSGQAEAFQRWRHSWLSLTEFSGKGSSCHSNRH